MFPLTDYSNMTTSRFRSASWGLAALTLCLSGATAHGAVVGNAVAGKGKIAMCIGCHNIAGYQASFPEIYKVPKIAGQNAKYIATALAAYQKGDRKHPTMKGVAASLSEQDMADIAAHYETLGIAKPTGQQAATPTASAEVASLLTKGNCVSCHGADMNKPIDGSYPKLAGQHADYLLVALKSYQTTGNPMVGRGNAIMAGQVKMFTLPELKLLAKHIASLPGDVQTIPQAKFKAQ
jgi:cytochrome c553